MSTAKIETRTWRGFELRAESQGDEMALTGYAALFNSPSKDLGGFRETIAPGAFTRSLNAGAEVKCLGNHDPNQILGRTKNKTLTLAQDANGLKFRCVLDPANSNHMNIRASVLRGDIDECSFAFTVPENGQQWSADCTQRTLTDVDLMDVSVVTYPAYNTTSVSARSAADYEPVAAETTRLRARLAALDADFARREKCHELTMRLMAETFGTETRGNQDWFADRCREACSDLGLDYCQHDNEHIYAGDPTDDEEENCCRFEYSCNNENGLPEINVSSRTQVKHQLNHAAGQAKRSRAADKELQFRMDVAAGRK
jgi:HK97 family phage prohead protease